MEEIIAARSSGYWWAPAFLDETLSSVVLGASATMRLPLCASEGPIEQQVSAVIRAMRFLWLPVNDPPGPTSLRGYIERNSIALLSNLGREPLDAASRAWLGCGCDRGRARVRDSGLWNQNHVDEIHETEFLDKLERLVKQA